MKVCCIIFWFFDSFNLIQYLDKAINLNMDLSVVVPVYNSEKIIDDLVKKINDSINNIKSINSHEIVLISDCSPDRSWRK